MEVMQDGPLCKKLAFFATFYIIEFPEFTICLLGVVYVYINLNWVTFATKILLKLYYRVGDGV